MNRKHIFAILACLMILGGLATTSINTVKAPVTEPIIMWAVINNSPYDGYYGGYWDVMYAIQNSLRDIGIDLKIAYYDAWTWWDIIWESKWNITGTAYGDPGTYDYGYDGWDISINGYGLNPTSYVWLDERILGQSMPPNGYNIHSWIDPKADDYYIKAQTTLDPVAHKNYMMQWQTEFMHDCPNIILYYQKKMTAQASYFYGYDPTLWMYTRATFRINQTKFLDPATQVPADRLAIGSDTLMWGAEHPIWSFFPFYTLTYTEEQVNDYTLGYVYRSTRENIMSLPPSGKFYVEPELADGFPTWGQLPDGRWYANITLKQGITWTDSAPFNATDFAFSVNSVLNRAVKSQAYRTYYLWDHADVLEPYKARIVYKPGLGPDYDLAGYIAQGWAWTMLPWHQLKDIAPTSWKVSTFATDPIPTSAGGTGLERLGPYIPIQWVSPNYLKLERRDAYCDAVGISKDLPKYFVTKVIPNSASRLVALQKLEVDFVEYPTAPVETWQSMITWPTHYVNPGFFHVDYPTLWLNKRNPILSNRYVRLAIAYAIPYPKIFNEIVPGWGVAEARPGKSDVMPIVDDFNTALGNYDYNITRARQYMDMWRYSQAGMTADYTKGPMGDHDFSGYVEIVDFPIWARWFGTSPTTDPYYPYPDKWHYTTSLPGYPYPVPGNDRDPDNDNNAYVEMKDFPLWASNFGKSYPYPGAW